MRTDEERQRITSFIREAHKSGTSIKDACKEAGISMGSWSIWKNEYKPKKIKRVPPTPQVFPMAQPFTLSGAPEEIAQFIRALKEVV